jgi:hypothetical protein
MKNNRCADYVSHPLGKLAVLATSLIRQGNSLVRDWKPWNSYGEGLQGMKRIESLRIR